MVRQRRPDCHKTSSGEPGRVSARSSVSDVISGADATGSPHSSVVEGEGEPCPRRMKDGCVARWSWRSTAAARRAEPAGRRSAGARRAGGRRRVAPALRPGPCRSQCADGRRRRRRAGHALRHAGAVLPPRQDAALHRCASCGRRDARGRRHERSVSGGGRQGGRSAAQAGVESGSGCARRRRGGSTAPYLTLLATGPALRPRQMGHDPRRQDRHAQRRLEMDQQRGVAPASPRPARPNGCGDRRHRHGPGRRSAADRAPAGTAHRCACGSG